MQIKTVEQRAGKQIKKSVIYVWLEGEQILENLVNRRARPYTEWRKMILASDQFKLPSGAKLTWSQTAGCSCGCSPGFFVKNEYGYAYGQETHVTITE